MSLTIQSPGVQPIETVSSADIQNQPLEQIVREVYSQILQRDPYPEESGAVQHWVDVSYGLRHNDGFSDQQIFDHLAAEFRNSQEYRDRFGTPPAEPEPTPPANDPPPSSSTPVEEIVTRAYREILQRDPYPDEDGVRVWSDFAQGLRNQGKSDDEIFERLAAEFRNSEEYRNLVGGTNPPADPVPQGAELRDMVQEVYRTILQREGEEAGVAHWTSVADGLRAEGMNDGDIRNYLEDQFRASDEYQARFGGTNPPANPPAEPTPTNPGTDPTGSSLRNDNGRLVAVDGGTQNLVAATYTDLGRVSEHLGDPYSQEFRDHVRADLQRLAGQGVDAVRVWADPPNSGYDGDPQRMAARIGVIAEEAAALGINISVDLVDSAYTKSVHEYRHGAIADELAARIPTVVAQNAHHSNVDWSIGNEIGDPGDPLGFAQWYEEQAALIRAHAGAGQGIIADLTPGAVGHPQSGGYPQAEEAMRRIVEASDIVSVHFYPHSSSPATSPDQVGGTRPADDWESLKTWARLANEEGRAFIIGEFGIPRDSSAPEMQGIEGDHARIAEMVSNWMREFEAIGADQVRLWQFMKDDAGHTDPTAIDFHQSGFQSVLDRLASDGWLHRPPSQFHAYASGTLGETWASRDLPDGFSLNRPTPIFGSADQVALGSYSRLGDVYASADTWLRFGDFGDLMRTGSEDDGDGPVRSLFT